jgi:hypothetical protein
MSKTKCNKPINYFDNCFDRKCHHFRECIEIRTEEIVLSFRMKNNKKDLKDKNK